MVKTITRVFPDSDASVLWPVSLLMMSDEQFAAFASAGFSEIRLEEEIGATILVTGRAPRARAEPATKELKRE